MLGELLVSVLLYAHVTAAPCARVIAAVVPEMLPPLVQDSVVNCQFAGSGLTSWSAYAPANSGPSVWVFGGVPAGGVGLPDKAKLSPLNEPVGPPVRLKLKLVLLLAGLVVFVVVMKPAATALVASARSCEP